MNGMRFAPGRNLFRLWPLAWIQELPFPFSDLWIQSNRRRPTDLRTIGKICMVDYENLRRPSARRALVLSALLWFLVMVTASVAQTKPQRQETSSGEVKALAEGWAALGQSDLAGASRAAQRALAHSPLSVAAIALAVEIDVTRGGPLAGLESYERWLGQRRLDDGYVLRRVARAHLESVLRQPQHVARLEAARALTADGDTEAAASLGQGSRQSGVHETRALASLGGSRAVQSLIAELKAPGGSKRGTINAIVESRSRQAIPALVELLADPREDNRAAAAEALGRLGASEAIPRLKGLSEDPVFPVRMAAASALYRLEDYSGVNLLEQLLASEHPAVRLGAAEALSVRPAGQWLGVVRDLTNVPDETVQIGAARLIAPYEPQTAAAVLERLQQSDNPAVREEAGRVFVQQVAGDFASLRRLLRSSDGVTAVRAAARILELTR
jgi:HEAT repeat protein